jgi:predicted RNase H-like HicB family nuclease
MKSDLKNKSCIVYDYGTFVGVAERLAKDFGKVMYYSPWQSSFPKKGLTMIGEGLPGITRINSFFDHLDEADMIVFPDCLDEDLQERLEDEGKIIWGSRRGNEMELDRIAIKEYMKKLGLPINPYKVVHGIKDLRTYLKEHKDIWVKINIFRADFETFFSKNYTFIESKLDEVEHRMGPLGAITDFLCEDDLPHDDYVEMAYDGYTVDGKYPTKTVSGIEIKDLGYIGVFTDYEKLPKCIKDFNAKLEPALKKYHYRNFFHPETRINSKGVGYMIDLAARAGSPPNEVYQLYENYSDIIWEGAHGKCIDPIAPGKYFMEVLIHSSHAQRNWQNVQFIEKYKDNLKWRNVTVIDGKYQIVPQYVELPEIGAVVAVGNTIDEAKDKIHEICDEIDGYYVETPKESLERAEEEIKKLKDFGIDLFD